MTDEQIMGVDVPWTAEDEAALEGAFAPTEHDDKGYSEEKCLRCGWVMGMKPLNCNNDDTPHRFPSQGGWWITTDFFANGGKKVLGPFESQRLALDVRDYVERVKKPATFAVDEARLRG